MTDLNQQIRILKSANRIAHILGQAQRFEFVIEDLMQEFLQAAGAEEGSIQLLRPRSDKTRRTLIRRGKGQGKLLENHLDDLMTGWVVKNQGSFLSTDVAATFGLGKAGERFSGVSAALAAPLLAKQEIIGVVNLLRIHPQKPFSHSDREVLDALTQEISAFIEQAQLREQIFDENTQLKQKLADQISSHGIIGNSPAMKEVFSLLKRVIPTDARVLIQGESGTGKEQIARFIHHAGPRKDGAFVGIDCGALPPNLLESELFGYVRGAFTGATQDRQGLFEAANDGTLFLDEIANMTLETQAKLLRVLQEGEIRPLGANQVRKVTPRVIAASSADLREKVAAGEFRQDLYYRLNVVPIKLPTLKERVEDIPVLATHFLKRFARRHQKKLGAISPAAIGILERYPWPGNVRELENIIERAVILADEREGQLLPAHLPYELSFPGGQQERFSVPVSGDLNKLLADFEREIIIKALRHHDWNKTAAGQALNISERVMRYKIERLRITMPDE